MRSTGSSRSAGSARCIARWCSASAANGPRLRRPSTRCARASAVVRRSRTRSTASPSCSGSPATRWRPRPRTAAPASSAARCSPAWPCCAAISAAPPRHASASPAPSSRRPSPGSAPTCSRRRPSSRSSAATPTRPVGPPASCATSPTPSKRPTCARRPTGRRQSCSSARMPRSRPCRSCVPRWSSWRRLDAPYEAAITRYHLGRACRAVGDEDGAQLEFDAARTVLTGLGAIPDLELT